MQDINYEEFLERTLLDKFNIEFFRYFFDRLQNQMQNFMFPRRASKYLSKLFGAKRTAGTYKTLQDFVDSEIVHFSIFGVIKQGQHHEIKIITCEKDETTRARITLYYTMIEYIRKGLGYVEHKNFIKYKFGSIYQICMEDGTIVNKTDVKDLIIKLEEELNLDTSPFSS